MRIEAKRFSHHAKLSVLNIQNFMQSNADRISIRFDSIFHVGAIQFLQSLSQRGGKWPNIPTFSAGNFVANVLLEPFPGRGTTWGLDWRSFHSFVEPKGLIATPICNFCLIMKYEAIVVQQLYIKIHYCKLASAQWCKEPGRRCIYSWIHQYLAVIDGSM